ncbi:hypothetical protein HYX19_01675 [Candidatus Woesearchaeota archaeon]|nr:hypothetical protein [Candidatus Woesearchaeota archaeon]
MSWYNELKYRKIIFGFVFLMLGFISLNYAFNQPCEINFGGDIAKELGFGLPKELSKTICMSSDLKSLFSSLVGIALIFPSVGAIVRGFTE